MQEPRKQLVVAMMMTDYCLKENKEVFSTILLSCKKKREKCMAVLKRSVGSE